MVDTLVGDAWRVLRVRPQEYREVLAAARPWTAGLAVVATYLVLGIGRFGFPVLSRPWDLLTLLADGVAGWMLLALVTWAVLRFSGHRGADFVLVWRATGHAHFATAALAFMVFATGFLFDFSGPGTVLTVVVLGAWFPMALLAAIRAATGLTVRAAGWALLPGYAVWLLVAARSALRSAGHLL